MYNASAAAHAIAIGNYLYATPAATDWNTVSTTLSNVLTDWHSNGLDAQVNAVLPRVSPSSITSANINQATLLANLQMYQPRFTLATVQQMLAYIDANSANVPGVLSMIQTSGMSYYLSTLVAQAQGVAVSLGGSTSAVVPSTIGFEPAFKLPPPPPPAPKPGYSCAADGLLIGAAAIALAVITIMTWGTDAILIGSFWGAFNAFGGVATGGWTGVHLATCPAG